MEAIDLNYLEKLSFENADLDLPDFRVLIGRLSVSDKFPLRVLNLRGTALSRVREPEEDFQDVHALGPGLRAMMPGLEVLGLEVFD